MATKLVFVKTWLAKQTHMGELAVSNDSTFFLMLKQQMLFMFRFFSFYICRLNLQLSNIHYYKQLDSSWIFFQGRWVGSFSVGLGWGIVQRWNPTALRVSVKGLINDLDVNITYGIDLKQLPWRGLTLMDNLFFMKKQEISCLFHKKIYKM